MPARLSFLELPLAAPSLRRAYHAALQRVLARGKLILGREVAAFESEFAKFCGARECVGVGNGTDALQIALRISGVRPGHQQEVITTPLTASFTAHAVVAAGGTPVFADVHADTLLIDARQVAAALSARTAVVLPVHLYGQACDLDALGSLTRARKIALVQDAAQAHGTQYRNKPVARFTEISCFSFYPTKNLGALGDAGALVTTSPQLSRQARLFRDGGRLGSHAAQMEGTNSRLDELQAAFLRIHLRKLAAWNLRRALLATTYDELFSGLGDQDVQPIATAKDSTAFPHLYVVRVRGAGRPAQGSRRRNALKKFLSAQGIETGIHYEQPLHLQAAFRKFGYERGDFPNAELASEEILSLPMHPFLPREQVRRVVRTIAKFLKSK